MKSPEIKLPRNAIHSFTTGIGSVHREHLYGTRIPRNLWALFSRSWVEMPINVFVIEHPDGVVLFDAGLDPEIKNDREYVKDPIVRFFTRRLFRLKMDPEETLANKLIEKGIEPSRVKKVVISHLHFDHHGGIGDVPQAELITSRHEWKRLSDLNPEREFIFKEHIELPGARWQQIDFPENEDPLFDSFGGYYDLMGDGSLILLPTPGHTPGSLSMLVRFEGDKSILLVGDLAYRSKMLLEDRVPGTGNPKELLATYEKVRELKKKLPGLVIFTAHDFIKGDIKVFLN